MSRMIAVTTFLASLCVLTKVWCDSIIPPRVEFSDGSACVVICDVSEAGIVRWEIDPRDVAAIESACARMDSAHRPLVRALARLARHERFR